MGNSFSLTQIAIPSGHQAVADQITIVNDGASYTATCISSGETRALSMMPLSFTATGKVQCSIWEFRSIASDMTTNYAFMTIFGPDNSGSTYWVEVSRASPNSLQLNYPTGSFNFGAGGNDGYVYFEVS